MDSDYRRRRRRARRKLTPEARLHRRGGWGDAALADVEFHLLDTGHFGLEDKADEMVPLIRDFLDRKVAPK